LKLTSEFHSVGNQERRKQSRSSGLTRKRRVEVAMVAEVEATRMEVDRLEEQELK
jgi:hypothetical protein